MSDPGPLLAAVTNEWERGKTIAERAGIDSRTAGPRLMSLVREGFVARSWTDKHGGVALYRRGPQAPAWDPPPTPEAVALAVAREDATRLYDALAMARGFLGMSIRSPNCAAFVADEAMAAHLAIEGGQ